MGKFFTILGIVFLCLGLLTTFGSQIPFLNKLGQLPGDFHIKGDHYSLYIPITTSILISIILTIVIKIITKI